MDTLCCLKKNADKVVKMAGEDSKVLSVVGNRSPPMGLAPEAAMIARLKVQQLPGLQGALRVSAIAPLLQEHGVRLIGIGFEPSGWEDFMQEKIFAGEHYLDTEKKTYAALEMPYMSFVQLAWAFMMPSFYKAFLKKDGVTQKPGGDPYQNGGCLIVSRGGRKILWMFREQKPHDSYPMTKITSALGIEFDDENILP